MRAAVLASVYAAALLLGLAAVPSEEAASRNPFVLLESTLRCHRTSSEGYPQDLTNETYIILFE